MAAVQKPSRTDWAEDSEPDLATSVPPPQITKNKDGTETVVTVYFNEEGKKVKRTQRIRRTVVKKKENPRVAERRGWAKFGPEAGKPAGPQSDTTTIGENIVFRPVVGFKAGGAQEKAPEEDAKAQQLKNMKIKCRICQGDHFTTKCPFKDTMAPEGDAAQPADMDAVAGDVGGGAGGGGAGGSYVPPHLRKGGAASGERMGGKYERDDLATLRVTNVSAVLLCRMVMNADECRSPNSPKRTTFGICSSASAVLPVSSWQRIARRGGRRALRSSPSRIGPTPRGLVRRWRAWATGT